ncbi:ComEC/Rec2 family competence protein [Clostridium aestuarii]|uniref:ComEC/Rec2 family competence protein n=1 Tax=Clostridium aestuarii TaxID=338193 RepID=A0ABT4CZE1_9CLOT|nr:ComEC/Rec2 family competence protein [Clostridium aestuarii]MCY6484352.1 ComEC/Rec2 family competence protein [Clostridium aestuarii]
MKFYKKPIYILLIVAVCIFTFIRFNRLQETSVIPSYENKLLVHYINVGQGDSILIQVNNKNILIDAGPKAKTVYSYLKKHKIKTLHYVIATHPHDDHIGGMSYVINKFKILEFYAPKKIANTETFNSMITALNKKNLKIIPIKAEKKLDIGKNASCIFVAPNNDNYNNTNNYSAVIKITYKNTSFLFAGDAEALSESEILNTGYNIKSDILKVGHHGSTSSTTTEFLNEVNPKVAVISCGQNNDYGHPNKETLSKLKGKNIIIYRTDIDGTIVLESNGEKIIKR